MSASFFILAYQLQFVLTCGKTWTLQCGSRWLLPGIFLDILRDCFTARAHYYVAFSKSLIFPTAQLKREKTLIYAKSRSARGSAVVEVDHQSSYHLIMQKLDLACCLLERNRGEWCLCASTDSTYQVSQDKTAFSLLEKRCKLICMQSI